ncbi:helix-turn-helix domain-containing protein [Tsukamurella sp. 8F]|uniref:helix-turn-helix domain-containing protein n=1 Tax=unclassified Tsukamurella TaxID=2633480 RepID=UPI0023B8E925|nr:MULTISPECIES: helix-turn-helix domain-containing protein [unclassified Tsukamurella]MDF0532533.1 helix-turn-helix domain-containing protein [Tsukamurella sp. 8J]MDF0588103.1 helix-turn-helix domain-containing protein [Tsukamurella sp. 8F]
MTTTQHAHPATDADELRSRVSISVPRAGQILGVSRATAYALVERGEVPSVRVGGRVLVPTAALRALLGVED